MLDNVGEGVKNCWHGTTAGPADPRRGLYGRNREAFLLLTAALDASVQLVYAQTSERFDAAELHGAVLGTNVRNNVIWYGQRPEMKASTFSISMGFNCSAVIVDSRSQPIRLRKHPRNGKTGILQSLSVPVEDTLFGPAPDMTGWEAAVLWDPDPVTQTLRRAWLAGVIVSPDKLSIFERIPLSQGSPSLFATDEQSPPVEWSVSENDAELNEQEDNFDDFFEDGSGGTQSASS